jgi:Domain of unknown function (DU1801)
MQYDAKTPDEYIAGLPEDRKLAISNLRKVIKKNLPKGFKETIGYGHLGWVVPHETYPPGYHCDPKQPLPFLGIASQKNFIALYSMSIYSLPEQLEWFHTEWPKHTSRKLDMGKSCIRFKKLDDIPLKLIGELASQVTPQEWVEIYERSKPR